MYDTFFQHASVTFLLHRRGERKSKRRSKKTLVFGLKKGLKKLEKKVHGLDKNALKVLISYSKEDDQYEFSDEEKNELVEIVDFLKHPKRFSNMGAKVPSNA